MNRSVDETEKTPEETPTKTLVKTPSLAEVLAKYGIALPEKKVRRLEAYCHELWAWNEKLNLTRHTDFEKFVTRDLTDTMELANRLQIGEHILDVGSGGGVPGVLLAILRPDLTIELSDSTGKKTEALAAICDALELPVPIWHAKAEHLLRKHRVHTLVIRAVSKLDKLLEMFGPCWFAFDRMLLIKGSKWVEERGEARHLGRLTGLALRRVAEYATPGEEGRISVILQVCRAARLAEMRQRDVDREAGIPSAARAESLAVENRPLDAEEPPRKKYPPAKKRGFRKGPPKRNTSSLRGPKSPHGSNSPRGPKLESPTAKSGERRGRAPSKKTGGNPLSASRNRKSPKKP